MSADLRLDLGDALRSLRRQQDLSQRELAQLAGAPISTIARIESGEITNPRLRTVERLVRAAGATVTIQVPEPPAGASPPPPTAEPIRDAAGRRYPAHLDVRAIYPYFGKDRRLQPPGKPEYTYQLDRAVRDARRRREAVALALPIERVDDGDRQFWQWVMRAQDGTAVGRLTAQAYPYQETSALPRPQTILCALEAAPQWPQLVIGQRLLGQLESALTGLGYVEVVTLVHRGTPAENLRQLGFHHPVRSVLALKLEVG